MSALVWITIDRVQLPTALLPVLKSHCRVEFARDDQYLTGVASRSIDLFERLTEWSVFARTFKWDIAAADGSADGEAWRWALPIRPVAGIIADDGGTDVSSQYKVVTAAPDMVGPAWMVRADGEPDPMPQIVLQVGYKTADEVPPGILDFVLRAGAWLYEYREAGMMPGADMLAYGNSLLAGQWVPRA